MYLTTTIPYVNARPAAFVALHEPYPLWFTSRDPRHRAGVERL